MEETLMKWILKKYAKVQLKREINKMKQLTEQEMIQKSKEKVSDEILLLMDPKDFVDLAKEIS